MFPSDFLPGLTGGASEWELHQTMISIPRKVLLPDRLSDFFAPKTMKQQGLSLLHKNIA
jgi:hypothetical protein